MEKDISKDLAVNTMAYFDEVTNNFNELQLPDVLKTYYLTKCRISGINTGVKISGKATDAQIRCPRCCVLYNDSNSSYKIEPEMEKTRSDRKLIKKQEAGLELTKFQAKYCKRISHSNHYVIKCGICGTDNRTKMKKPTKEKSTPPEEKEIERAKKKKKKDKSAGLNIQNNASSNNNNNVTPKSNISNENHNKKTPGKLQMAFVSNKEKKQMIAAAKGINLSNERSENSKKTKLNKLGKILKNSPKNSPSSSLKNFLKNL